MTKEGKLNVGVGFVTGRRNFRKVLKTYAYRWKQTASAIKDTVRLNLFVAYDLEYNNTQIDDYININSDILDILDSVFFVSNSTILNEINTLAGQGVTTQKEAELLFDKGYAGKRNALLYYALKSGMDYLIFLDDDEYPLAVTKARDLPVWSGQDIFARHLEHLAAADITNGMHCGYISPIPDIAFGDAITERDFQLFIEAISNDILEWDKMKRIMDAGGVTYADPNIFVQNTANEVQEVNRTKFISGSNLGINLTQPQRVKPFYNPPKARGEDTFLSTCLTDHKVLRIPCYTFHDGFSVYDDLLDGVLPLQMRRINTRDEKTVMRFYRACVGWVRYKPLLLYITNPAGFEEEVAQVNRKLDATLPKLCNYFGTSRFQRVGTEFAQYCRMVPRHHKQFSDNQLIWENIKDYALQQAY